MIPFKKICSLYIYFAFLLPVACTKDNGVETVEPPSEFNKYTFIELEYDFSDIKEHDFDIVVGNFEYNNPSDVEQVLPIGDNISPKNFMFFEAKDEPASSFFYDSITVHIPEYIDDKRIYLTKDKYLLSSNNIDLPIEKDLNVSLPVKPNSTVKIQVKQVLKEYTIGFHLIYKDNVLNQKKSIQGKWKHIKFLKLDYEYL